MRKEAVMPPDIPAPSGLTPDERHAFEADGFVRLAGALDAQEMQEAWWVELAETRGVLREDPATWRPQHGAHSRQLPVRGLLLRRPQDR